jgi:hypothetical protein
MYLIQRQIKPSMMVIFMTKFAKNNQIMQFTIIMIMIYMMYFKFIKTKTDCTKIWKIFKSSNSIRSVSVSKHVIFKTYFIFRHLSRSKITLLTTIKSCQNYFSAKKFFFTIFKICRKPVFIRAFYRTEFSFFGFVMAKLKITNFTKCNLITTQIITKSIAKHIVFFSFCHFKRYFTKFTNLFHKNILSYFDNLFQYKQLTNEVKYGL